MKENIQYRIPNHLRLAELQWRQCVSCGVRFARLAGLTLISFSWEICVKKLWRIEKITCINRKPGIVFTSGDTKSTIPTAFLLSLGWAFVSLCFNIHSISPKTSSYRRVRGTNSQSSSYKLIQLFLTRLSKQITFKKIQLYITENKRNSPQQNICLITHNA